MALNRINADSIADGTVVAADILDGTITLAKLASGTPPSAAANGAFTAANAKVNAANTTSFSANVTFTYPVFLSNTVTIQQTLETTNVSATAAGGTVNFDILVSPVLYTTSNATGNFTVNFRANSAISLNSVMSNNQSLSLALITTQGSTAYYNSAYQIDGASVTPKWQGGTAPTTGNASGIDVYGYTIIKTANATFTVLASQTQFK